MANELGLRNVAFEVDDLQAAVDWAAAEGYGLVGGIGEYEGGGGWPTSGARRGSSSRWPNRSVDPASDGVPFDPLRAAPDPAILDQEVSHATDPEATERQRFPRSRPELPAGRVRQRGRALIRHARRTELDRRHDTAPFHGRLARDVPVRSTRIQAGGAPALGGERIRGYLDRSPAVQPRSRSPRGGCRGHGGQVLLSRHELDGDPGGYVSRRVEVRLRRHRRLRAVLRLRGDDIRRRLGRTTRDGGGADLRWRSHQGSQPRAQRPRLLLHYACPENDVEALALIDDLTESIKLNP